MIFSPLIIATRKSPLALWQAHWVKAQLEKHHPSIHITLLGLTTLGDKIKTGEEKSFTKGLFIKELEEALLDGRADIAVHSMKDVPMVLSPAFCLPVLCEREDPRDAFISNQFESLMDLPAHARVGTSSLRRQSQLYALRPDIRFENLRGNINTRLTQLDHHAFDAIILAAAGLKRLGLEHRITSYLSIEQSLPAPGQGVLGIECRADDLETQAKIALLNHSESHVCVTAERAMCNRLGGGCHVPIAAYATLSEGKIRLRGLVARPDGTLVLQAEQLDDLKNAKSLGVAVAENLIQQGADSILNTVEK